MNFTTSSTPLENIVWQTGKVLPQERAAFLGQRPMTVWLTGLSGSGKSTLAFEVERQLLLQRRLAFVLDGDNVRHGLNLGLGFSPEDRHENIRRVAEVAKLFNEAGLIVVTSFISPYRQDRELARKIVGEQHFMEIHLCTDLAVCEGRDPKGLYRKARQGLLPDFTGINAPYETPLHPTMALDTGRLGVEECVERILGAMP